MTIRTLFDNLQGTPGTGSGGPNFVLGTPFDVTADCTITHCGFYRPNTTGTVVPTKFSIYRRSDQAQLVAEFDAEGGTGEGWVYTALPAQYAVTAGAGLVVAALYPVQSSWGRLSGGSRPTAPLGISWPTNTRQYKSSADMVYPDSADTTYMEAITVKFDSEAPIADPTTVAAIEQSNLMAAWFSSGAANKQTGQLPKLTYDAVDTVESSLSSVQTKLGDIVGEAGDDLAGVITTIKNSVGTGLKTAVDGITTTLGGVSSGMVQTLNTVASTVSTILNDASDGLVGVLNFLSGGGGALPPVAAVPGTGWALAASTAFDGSLAWSQDADLYVVTFTTTPGTLDEASVAGVDVIYRLGWWSVLNGTQPGQRGFVDFPLCQLADGGRRMPGLLLHCPRGGVGTVDAWIYTP